jgi:hypothetical protein
LARGRRRPEEAFLRNWHEAYPKGKSGHSNQKRPCVDLWLVV